ncbi:MAG: MarR family transcriptional regulator [Ectobacillus sp.]
MKDLWNSDYIVPGQMASEEDKKLWKLYMQVIHGAGVGDVDAWVQLDLSMTQMKILMLLNAHGKMTVSALADHMHTSMSNMTGILDRLEGLGFVERFPSEQDRRSVLVQLTEKAKALFQRLVQSSHYKLQRALQFMDTEERKLVEDGLKVLARALQRATVD